MIEQHIHFDKVRLDPLGKSIVNANTEALSIYIDDLTPSTECQLVGDKFEWKPFMWMQHEVDRLQKLNTINIVILNGILQDHVKEAVRKVLATTEVHFFDLLLQGSFFWLEDGKALALQDSTVQREGLVHLSIGTMRLHRFILAAWLQKNKISFGKPKIGDRELERFRDDIARIGDFDTFHFDDTDKKFFGNISEGEFNIKQAEIFDRHRIAIVAPQQWYDHLHFFCCEKFSHAVARKCLPFFVGNGDDNHNITKLGFRSYRGLRYNALDKSNYIDRWQSLLNDNRSFFINEANNQQIYERNKDIIEFNFNHLISTDWNKKAEDELVDLPDIIREKVKQFSFGYHKK